MKKPNFTAIKNAVTSTAGINVLKIKKQSPNIMFGVGVVGVIATVVLASKATLQLDEILDEHDNQIDDFSGAVGQPLKSGGHYTEDDRTSDVRKQYVFTAGKIVKLYGPAFVVGVASIGCLTGAHVALNRRNAGLMAAYASIDTAFKAYRERVVAEQGEDKDREYAYGVDTREVYTEKKNGEPVVKDVKTAAGASQYAKFFQRPNYNYETDPNHNIFFLKSQQTYANQKLAAQGYLMLSDVYDALGFERTPESCVVGWVKDNPNGDGYISFGCWDDESMERFYDFMTGREDKILVDFNVDGVVYDLLDKL
jgi:hypothetical protein